MLVAKDAVGFCLLSACIFDKCGPEFEEVVHEGYGAIVVEEDLSESGMDSYT
jgi:hypothetical protein